MKWQRRFAAGVLLAGAACQAPLRAQTQPVSACSDSAVVSPLARALGGNERDAAATAERSTLRAVDDSAYPELRGKKIEMRAFHSRSDYFRTRFSLPRFLLLLPMKYFVEVNPELAKRSPPPEGVCAILAHESAHLVTLSRGNRIRRFGLMRLLSRGYTVKFERRADLETIRRGFGPGLEQYREWVYRNIPPGKTAEKKRNYFSPEEIEAILAASRAKPELFARWEKQVPLNRDEILSSAQDPAAITKP